jgi:dTDP-4-dehydrorhamnose reductase
VGSPTYTVDLAEALVDLVRVTDGGLFHLVNDGRASRLEWAEQVLAVRRPGRPVLPISRSAFVRASDPPPWGVLDASKAARVAGIRMRAWVEALRGYLGGSGIPTG